MSDDLELIPGELGHPPAKKMCAECPLNRGAIKGYLGGYTPEQYIRMMHSDASVACHMSKGFHERRHDLQRHCTGVAHYRANAHKLPRTGGAQQAVLTAGENHEEVFSNPEEFRAHHTLPEGADYWGEQNPPGPSRKGLAPRDLTKEDVSLDAALVWAARRGGGDAAANVGAKLGLTIFQVLARLSWLHDKPSTYHQQVEAHADAFERELARQEAHHAAQD